MKRKRKSMPTRDQVIEGLKELAKNNASNIKSYQEARTASIEFFARTITSSQKELKKAPNIIYEMVARTLLFYDFLKEGIRKQKSFEELVEMKKAEEDYLKTTIAVVEASEKEESKRHDQN
jgi:hypothetical protein